MRVSISFGSPFGMFSIRSWALVVILLVMIGAINWSLGASPGASAEPSLVAFHPRVEFGEGWKSSVLMATIGSYGVTLWLFAYDAGTLSRKFLRSEKMKKRHSGAIIVLSLLLIYGFSTAQELGGSGGSGMSNQKAIKDSVKTSIAGQLSFKGDPIGIDMGSPEIGNDEGIFIWLDETKTWQIRWQGEADKLVWIRLTTQNPISNVVTIGERVNAEMKDHLVVVVTGTTTSEAAGISFKSETPAVDIDAKWNTARDTSRINISAEKIKPASLPTTAIVTVYNDVGPLREANQESNLNVTPAVSGGHGEGKR